MRTRGFIENFIKYYFLFNQRINESKISEFCEIWRQTFEDPYMRNSK